MLTRSYISDNGGVIQLYAAVHPSVRARRGRIESLLPDGANVPVHGDKHATPAEGPILLPRQRQVQLLLRGQVGIGSEDPVRVAVSVWVGLEEEEAAAVEGQ